ncbi:lipoprotein [Spiroplasma monobiae]|uniref:Lipoprotein n=1 Tax=Spiroplasma monobiae MQ-1 TaxID=1336748 RepID=A0A2K9LWQ7_SPISQ|nr:lipoprotein [Spiroplasma monobiae]AUM62825.1 hypothetical protein SMONO_v1c05760 [Spiroplasma monobiae MQ-1]
MKKILTLLSAVSLTATASASVVACGGGDGGGTIEPPTTNIYKVDEVFIEREIEEISVDYNPHNDSWMRSLYVSMNNRLIDMNYDNNKSKIGKVAKRQDMRNTLNTLPNYYSQNKNNENYEKLSELSEGLKDGENLISNFKFKMIFNHSDIMSANKDKEWEVASKQITEKMDEGTIVVSIKELKIIK